MTQEKKENDKTKMKNDEQETCGNSEVPHIAEGKEKEELVSFSDDLKADVEQKQTDLQDDEQPENDDIHQLPSLLSLVILRHEGETCEGQFHGEGVACFEGGHVYKGMFSKGLMEGHGVFTRADGLKYEGEFVCNMPMGQGTYTWLDGSSYEGEVYNGIRHGTGTYKCSKNVVSYTGEWDQGKRHGRGTVYYNQEKTSWYKGDWVKNNREGWGVRHYSSGNIYSGEWQNNLRHGEGTMRWINLQQQYDGMWQNGVQHGRGTHVWILRRADLSHYSQSNQYSGDFVQGLRHGQGTFYYAGGPTYEGEWRENKKHGKGKFIFEDGRVFEGEFVDDQMMTPDLNGNNAPTPPLPGKTEDTILFLPDMALNIDCLLEKIPERKRDTEREQVELVVLRQARELRSVYSFYSRLGKAHSPDNTFLLSRLQLWRLLKDCNIHHHGITLTQIDRFTREDATTAEIHSPFTPVLLRRLLSCLVVVAYHIYHKDMVSQNNLLAACFSKLMTDNILPNSKNVKGFLSRQPDYAVVAESYIKKCWEVYQAYCKVNPARGDHTMTCRHLLWMFKDLHLLDNNLTTARLLQIITAESQDPSYPTSCLDLEITFLEFFEVLLGSAEVKCQQVSEGLEEEEGQLPSSPDAEARSDLPPEVEAIEGISQTTNSPSQEVAAPVNSPVSPEISSTKSLETSDTAELSTAQDVVSQQEVKAEVNEESLSAEHTEEPRGEEKDMQKTSGMEVRDREVELWEQMIHQFFNHFFFPAVEHNQLVSRNMKEEKLRQEAQRRIALAKALQRAASLTGHKEADE